MGLYNKQLQLIAGPILVRRHYLGYDLIVPMLLCQWRKIFFFAKRKYTRDT